MKDLVREINSMANKNEAQFTSEIIYKILKNPFYAAIQKPKKENGEPVDNIKDYFCWDENENGFKLKYKLQEFTDVEPIIDREQWIEAITKWRRRYTEKSEPIKSYLFKDLLYCGHDNCGGKLYLTGTKNKYYRCQTKGCSSFKAEIVKKTVLNQIIDKVIDNKSFEDQIIKYRKEQNTNYKKAQNDLNQIVSKKYSLLSDYVKHKKNSNLEEKIRELVEEENSIKEEIYRIEDKINKTDYFLNWIKDVENKSSSSKQIKRLFLSDEELAQDKLLEVIDKIIISEVGDKINVSESFKHEQ